MTMAIAAAALQVVGAINTYQQGKIQQQQYNLQAKMASAEGERRALQYQQRANDILRRQQSSNAALAARAYAGGVNPFSGSPDIVRAANDTAAGREYVTVLADADAALRGGAIQAQIYEQAGEAAARRGRFEAGMKLATAAVTYGSTTGAGTQSPAPVETRTIPRG